MLFELPAIDGRAHLPTFIRVESDGVALQLRVAGLFKITISPSAAQVLSLQLQRHLRRLDSPAITGERLQ